MRTFVAKTSLLVTLFCASASGTFPGEAWAQGQTSPVAPTLIPVSGRLLTPEGQPRTGAVDLVISLYDGQSDASPRWIEQQLGVTLDATGGYSIQFGATLPDGLPGDLFTTGGGTRWLGIGVQGETEQPRAMLVSVPYAAKAASAETLGGKAASDFVLTSTFRDDLRTVLQEEGVTGGEGGVGTEAIANSLQKSDGGAGLLDTSVYEIGGNVGIGTTTPGRRLDISGSAGFVGAIADTYLVFRPGGVQTTLIGAAGAIKGTTSTDLGLFAESARGISFMVNGSPNDALRITSTGRVGIGTSAPGDTLDVAGNARLSGPLITQYVRFMPGGTQHGMFGLAGPIKGNTSTDLALYGEAGSGVVFMVNGSANDAMKITADGRIGIGTSSPTAKFHVAGDVVVDGNIGAKYQDVAEWVDAVGPLDAGTVVIIDPRGRNRVMGAAKAYESSVAGAVSLQPGLTLGEAGPGRVLVAQSGRVRVKADATFGAIRAGDLLVTSPTEGHVMKSKPIKMGGQTMHRPGTLVGKALEGLDAGRGEILVLLTLQ